MLAAYVIWKVAILTLGMAFDIFSFSLKSNIYVISSAVKCEERE